MPVPSSLAGRLATVALALASAFAALRLYPHELPQARHPDLLAVVFYSRAMVFAGRVTLLCLAAFAILSIAARIARREWLLRAGPFEVERAVGISERERDELKEALAEQRIETAQLEARVMHLPSGWRFSCHPLTRRPIVPLTDEEAQRLRQIETSLMEIADEAGAMVRRIDRAIRESDRRAEEYLPILRRAGLAPPLPRRSRWL
jgi:hypothetical protein